MDVMGNPVEQRTSEGSSARRNLLALVERSDMFWALLASG